MSQQPTIAVLGATGAQGGGLVRAMLADPARPFAVRALTRDPSSEKARALARLGAEVVAADLDDESSLARAFAGAYGVFAVTFFWEHFSPTKEQAQIRNIAHAAKQSGAAHVIWSTLEDTRRVVPLGDTRMPTLMHFYKVPHSDAKGAMDYLFRDLGVPTTFLVTSFFWDNLIHFGMGPKRGADGRLTFALPMGDKKLPGIAAEDIGKVALGIFARGTEHLGKTVGIAGEHLTGEEMARALGTAFGEPVRYDAIALEAYRHFPLPAAEELANMFQFKQEFNEPFCASRNVALTRALNPQLQTFARWLDANKDRLAFEKLAA